MAAGIVLNKTRIETQPTWQLLKSPTANQTALTAAQLSQAFEDVSFAEDNFEVIDASSLCSIAVQAWGVAAATNTFTLELYGWGESGPGHHIQQMAANVFGAFVSAASAGWHQAARTHPSIKGKFAAATEYRGAYSYLLTAAKDFSVKIDAFVPAVQVQTNAEADFPAEFVVDFANLQLRYFGIAVTAQTGTSVGAIFKPLRK